MKCNHRTVLLAVLSASLITARSEVRYLAHGHTDLAVEYDAVTRAWNLHVGSDALGTEFAPEEVILKVKAGAQTTVASDPKFGFLGVPGSPVWILPEAQDEDLLYLGYGGEGIPDGVFVGNQVKVALKSVTGPGNLFSYRVDSLGTPEVFFNTADGIGANDVATIFGGGDAHLAWAFSQPGKYTVVLEAAAPLVTGNSATSSGPVPFTFTVGDGPAVLTAGHTDLAMAYSEGEDGPAWDVHVGSDALEESYDADDVILSVQPEALTIVPTNNVKFDFLGNPGDPIWILPAAQNENLLYLGYGGEDIPEGVFENDQVKVTLENVEGPGNFFSYTIDGFGNPQILFNTADGISTNDAAMVQAGGDAHVAWAFSQFGTYDVTVEVSAKLAGTDTMVSSGPVTYRFSVLKPKVMLTVEHTDLRVLYDPAGTNKLSLVARDEVHGVNFQTNEVVLVVAEAARLTLPSGTPFGPEGAPLWVLPQSQDPNLLYLGLSAEGIAPSAFSGGLSLRLKSVDGPGDFFLWQAGESGFDVQMNSEDGISAADAHVQVVGSHEHFNFGFTTNGIYHIALQVSGTLAGSTNIESLVSGFEFHVLPLPTNAPPSEIELRAPQLLANGDFQVELTGAADFSVEIQASADLKEWTAVASSNVTASPQVITIPADTSKAYRFFRVHQK